MAVLCGPEELTGACFFWGLSGLLQWCQDGELRGMVSSILYLLGDASILRVNRAAPSEPFRLGICPLSQLVDMFRLREATDPREKVYALLGIMSQDTMKIDIKPDYGIDWEDLFRNLVRAILGEKVEAAWNSQFEYGYGRISAKGCTVGYISNVDELKGDRQVLSITRTYLHDPVNIHDGDNTEETVEWALHSSAAAVEQGDIVCWLEGSTGATVIRLQGDSFTIVVAWARFSTAFEESLFLRPELSSNDLNHEERRDEAIAPTRCNRSFVLLWPFDSKWKPQRIQASELSKGSSENVSALACIAQVLEDVNSKEALQCLFEQGSYGVRSHENAPVGVVKHLQDLGKSLPNWHLYLNLKRNLRSVLCLEGASPNEIELDLVEVRSRLSANHAIGTELIRKWFSELSPYSYTPDRNLKKLAFLLDVWGHTISFDTMIGLVELFEQASLQQRATLEMFSTHLQTGVIEVFVQSAAQHPDWGIPLAEKLIRRAKGGFDRMYCLVRALIICSTASSEWKQTIVQAVLDTHSEESFRAKVETSWASPHIEEPYEAAIDFLWRQYILEAKDFVGISPSGTFQLRRELMQEFIDEYRFWKACYDGNLADVRSRAAEGARVRPLLITCKDTVGTWCRVSAVEAAVMNGHVACCRLLIALLNGNEQHDRSCMAEFVIQAYLVQGGHTPKASEISDLLYTINNDGVGRKISLTGALGQNSSEVISRNERRSETW